MGRSGQSQPSMWLALLCAVTQMIGVRAQQFPGVSYISPVPNPVLAGQPFTLSVIGNSFDPVNDKIVLIPSYGTCGSTMPLTASLPSGLAGFQAQRCNGPGGGATKMVCQGVTIYQTGSFAVCFCSTVTQSPPVPTTTGARELPQITTSTTTTTTTTENGGTVIYGCRTIDRFFMGGLNTGTIAVNGPSFVNVLWKAGAPAALSLSGSSLSSSDRIRIVPADINCNNPSHSKAFTSAVQNDPFASVPNGRPDPSTSSSSQEVWSRVALTQPGNYSVCWCSISASVSSACVSDSDFMTTAAAITVAGPLVTPQALQCVTGVTCNLAVQGSGMSDNDRITVIAGRLQCGSAQTSSSLQSPADPSSAQRTSGDSTVSTWGGVIVGSSGTYKVCWCGRYNAATCPTCCTQPTDFSIFVGNLTVGGPQQGQATYPQVALPFSYTLQGWGMTDFDRIMIVDTMTRCGNSQAAWSKYVYVQSLPVGAAGTATGVFGNRTSLTWDNIIVTSTQALRVCWCAYRNGGCLAPSNFALEIGIISPLGPLNATFLNVVPGRPFELPVYAKPGSVLALGDRIRLVRSQLSKGQCGGAGSSQNAPQVSQTVCWPTCSQSPIGTSPVLFAGNDTVAANTSQSWNPVLLTDSGVYDLCWCNNMQGGCQTDSNFLVYVGQVVATGVVRGLSFSCGLKLQCVLQVPFTGGATLTDAIQLIPNQAGRECGLSIRVDAGSFSFGTRISGVLGTSRTGAQVLQFNLGSALATGTFQVCYCQGSTCQSAFVKDLDFFQEVGLLTVSGIQNSASVYICYLNYRCSFNLGGIDLSPADALMLNAPTDTCGQAGGQPIAFATDGGYGTTSGFLLYPGTQVGTQDGGLEQWNFTLGTPPRSGVFKLCYCQQTQAASGLCSVRTDFQMLAGQLYVRGSQFQTSFNCNQGDVCVITLRGQSFSMQDRILLVRSNSSCGIPGAAYPSWMVPITPDNVQADTILPELFAATFTLTSVAEPGAFHICYCASIVGGPSCMNVGVYGQAPPPPPTERYVQDTGTLTVMGVIKSIAAVGESMYSPFQPLPASPSMVSIEADAFIIGQRLTCAVTAVPAPTGFTPMMSDLVNCTNARTTLNPRQLLFPPCLGIATTPDPIYDLGLTIVHIPITIPANKVISNVYVWCYAGGMCGNNRCVVPASSTGLVLPMTGGVANSNGQFIATVSSPFSIQVALSANYMLDPVWPRIKLIAAGGDCTKNTLAYSVSGITCIQSGVGKCEPACSTVVGGGSWGAGRQMIWSNLSVASSQPLDVCYCDRHYEKTSVAWQRIGALQISGPRDAGSLSTWGNPGNSFFINISGSGFTSSDRIRIVVSTMKWDSPFATRRLLTGRKLAEDNLVDWHSGPPFFVNGTYAQWQARVDMQATYNVAWCGGSTSSCAKGSDFTVLLGQVQVAPRADCQLSDWWAVGTCSVQCGGGTVTMRRNVAAQPTGGGQPCPGSEGLYKVQSCNLDPCPLAQADVVTLVPSQPTAQNAFIISISGQNFDPAKDMILLLPAAVQCGSPEANSNLGGAVCNQLGSSPNRLVCGDGRTSLWVQNPGSYRICVCDGTAAIVKSFDGTHNLTLGSTNLAGITAAGCNGAYAFTINPAQGQVFQVVAAAVAAENTSGSQGLSAGAVVGITGAIVASVLVATLLIYRLLRNKAQKNVVEPLEQKVEKLPEESSPKELEAPKPAMDTTMLAWYEAYYQSLGYPPGSATTAFTGATAPQQPQQLALPPPMQGMDMSQPTTWLALQNAPRPPSALPLALPPHRPPSSMGRSPRGEQPGRSFGDLVSDANKRPSTALPAFTDTSLSPMPTPTCTPRGDATPRDFSQAASSSSALALEDGRSGSTDNLGGGIVKMSKPPLGGFAVPPERPKTGDSNDSGDSLAFSESSAGFLDSRPSTGTTDGMPPAASSEHQPLTQSALEAHTLGSMNQGWLPPVKEEEEEGPKSRGGLSAFVGSKLGRLLGSGQKDEPEDASSAAPAPKSRLGALWDQATGSRKEPAGVTAEPPAQEPAPVPPVPPDASPTKESEPEDTVSISSGSRDEQLSPPEPPEPAPPIEKEQVKGLWSMAGMMSALVESPSQVDLPPPPTPPEPEKPQEAPLPPAPEPKEEEVEPVPSVPAPEPEPVLQEETQELPPPLPEPAPPAVEEPAVQEPAPPAVEEPEKHSLPAPVPPTPTGEDMGKTRRGLAGFMSSRKERLLERSNSPLSKSRTQDGDSSPGGSQSPSHSRLLVAPSLRMTAETSGLKSPAHSSADDEGAPPPPPIEKVLSKDSHLPPRPPSAASSRRLVAPGPELLEEEVSGRNKKAPTLSDLIHRGQSKDSSAAPRSPGDDPPHSPSDLQESEEQDGEGGSSHSHATPSTPGRISGSPSFAPGPALFTVEGDFDYTTNSQLSVYSGESPSGSRKKVSLGGLARSSGAATLNVPKVSSPTGKNKPKKPVIATRSPQAFERPDGTPPPPMPPPSPGSGSPSMRGLPF